MRYLISIFLLLFFTHYNHSLFAQCESPKKRYVKYIEKEEYERWIEKWEGLSDKVYERPKYQVAFECQSEIILDKLIGKTEAFFTVKDKARLNKSVTTYHAVVSTVRRLYPIFFHNANKDYFQYGEYMDFLALVNSYADDNFSSLGQSSIDQQLCSALDKLLEQGNNAVNSLNLGLGKRTANDYLYLLDKLSLVDNLLGKKIKDNLPSSYLDKYNYANCIPDLISANIAFNKELYVEAFEYSQCKSKPSLEFFKNKLQDFVDVYNDTMNTERLVPRAKAIANFDAIVEVLSAHIIDTLPCPSFNSPKKTCDFRDIVDVHRQKTIQGLLKTANVAYRDAQHNNYNYKTAISMLEFARNIHQHKPKKDSLTRMHNQWVKEATISLEEMVFELIERKKWVNAHSIVKDIKSFNEYYDSKLMNSIINLHRAYSQAKDSLFAKNWEASLTQIELAYNILKNITCKSCPKITEQEIIKTRNEIIASWESNIDRINERGNLVEAEKQTDMIAFIIKSYQYPIREKKLRLQCIHFKLKGDSHKKLGEWKSAYEAYDKALSSCKKRKEICTECTAERELITDIKRASRKLANNLLRKAETPYNNGNYISACELVKRAKKWVKIYNKCDGKEGEFIYENEHLETIEKRICGKARKTVRIEIKQSSRIKFDNPTFNSLKISLENRMRSALKSTRKEYAKYLDLVTGINADFTIYIDIENIEYSFKLDYSPTLRYFCTYYKYYPNPYSNRYTLVYSSTQKIMKYNDSAHGKIHYRSRIDRYSSYGGELLEKWNKETWRANADPNTLASCSCPVKYLTKKELSHFKNDRQEPGLKNLLFSPLKQGLFNNIPNWIDQLDDLMKR